MNRLYGRRSERLVPSPDQLPLVFGEGDVVPIIPDVTEDEESTFKSPNDVKNLEQKTENILDAIDNELAALEADLDDKQGALDAMNPDDEGYDDAVAARDDAEEALNDRLAEVAGVDADTITQMRKDGDGYGLICHKLGLHPSILGNRVGQKKASQHTVRSRHRNRFGDDDEFSATTRDVKNAGLAKGHNKSVSEKSNGKGKGKADSFDIDDDAKAKGKSNGKGGGKGGGKDKK